MIDFVDERDRKKELLFFDKKESVPQNEYDVFLRENRGVLDAIGRVCSHSIYVLDYVKQNFLYVSANPSFLSTAPRDEVTRLGFEFYWEQLHPEDFEVLRHVKQKAVDFLKPLPIETWVEYTLSINLRVKDGHGGYIVTNHRWTPLQFTTDGHLWLSLCAVSLAVDSVFEDVYIQFSSSQVRWVLNRKSNGWVLLSSIALTDAEKRLITLAAQGLSIADMADRLHKSEITVKKYRKSLFEKFNVTSMNDVIVTAMTHKLL